MAEAVTGTMMQLSFFIILALFGTLVSLRLRQPYVVGLLVFGMLAGPNMLDIINDENLILTFSELGTVLLLFAVGIEFSVSRMLKSSFRAVLVTAFKMGMLFFFGYEVALLFGFGLSTSLYIGAMISISSTAIMFKMVNEKGLGKNPIMSLLFSMLIVEDIVAVAALTFFSSLAAGEATHEVKLYSVLVPLALLGAFYLLVRKPAARAMFRLTSMMNDEVTLFISFSLCLVMSMVAGMLGLTPSIGAFLAGSIVASLPNSRRIERTIKPLLLMFAALFFLSLGMRIDPSAIMANFWFAAVLAAVFAAVCFGAVLTLLYLTGARVKNSVFAASAMVVLGEFSLIIASLAPGEEGRLLLAVGSFGVVATALLSSFLLGRQERLLLFGQNIASAAICRQMHKLAIYFTSIMRDFSPGGKIWRISKEFFVLARRQFVLIAAIAILMVIARFSIGFFGLASGKEAANLRVAILMAGLLPIAYLAFGILRDFKVIIDAISLSIVRHKRNAADETKILRDLAAAVFFVLAALALPDLRAYLQLPSFFGFVDEAFIVIAFIFLWDMLRHAGNLRFRARA